MQTTSTDYKLEIKKPSRSFGCKITIGNNIYTNDDIVDIILETIQPGEGFSIGNTPSQTLDLTILNKGDIIYSTSQVKVEIGLKIGTTIEYILMGYFNIDDIEKTDYTTKITAYDNMIKFETPYFSNLGDTSTLQQVVNELATKTGVQFTGSLPAYTVKKLEGFTCREILGYVSSLCGGNALITRDGKFTIVTPKDIDHSITPDNYIDYKREEVKYKIGKVSCKVGDKELNKGSLGIDSMEVKFENPWVTDIILTDIYTKLNGFEYLGYTMKWQGDISLDVGDIVTCTDIKGAVRKIPILSQRFTYNGGLTAEIGAKGETKNKNSFNSSGSGSNKLDRVVTELLIVNEALINKANIQDLEAVSIRTQTIEAKTAAIEVAIIDVAHVSDLTAINANIEKLIAADATMGQAIIGKANIADLNAANGKINILESSIGDIQTLLNGNLTSNNIHSLILTSDKVTVQNGFIKNAMIESLDVGKINAGDISTNKFRIKSDNGGIEIVGATQQFKDKNNKVRIQMGQDAIGNFNFILRGEDGTTTLIDHTGIKENAICDDLIKSNMISENAVGGKQIDYNSFTEEFNADTNTNTLKSSKVLLDESGQTLNVVFNILNNTVDGVKTTTESNTTAINVQQGKIDSLISNTTIVKDGVTTQLKDAYNSTVATVDSISSVISSHTSTINNLTGQVLAVDTKTNEVKRTLDGTVATVSNHTTSINGLNSTVSTQSSTIAQMKDSIALKVESTEVTNIVNGAIDKIEVGGRNLLIGTSSEFKKINTGQWYGRILECPNDFNSIESLGLKVGDNIIYRIYLKANTTLPAKARITYYSDDLGGGKVAVSGNTISAGNEGYSEVSLKITSSVLYLGFGIQNGDTTQTSNIVEYKQPKLEKGTKATDWTPAPEDVDASINDVGERVTTTNNKVSTIETNLNGITNRVGTVEQTTTTIDGKVKDMDTRLKTAELKITDSAIISTVSNTFLTKDDANDTYATTSSVTQTLDAVRFEFNSKEVINLLSNSSFTGRGTTGWSMSGIGYYDGNPEYFMPFEGWRAFSLLSDRGLLYQPPMTGDRIPKKNTQYTFSLSSIAEQNIGTFRLYIDYKLGSTYVANTIADLKPGNNRDRYSISFTTPNTDYDTFLFYIETKPVAGTTGYRVFSIGLPCLSKGDNGSYTARQNEVISGSTKIDANGVTIMNGALDIKNNAGYSVLKGDSNGDLVIGGTNASGSLIIKNTSGTTIGTFNKDGVDLTDTGLRITSSYSGVENNMYISGKGVTFNESNIVFGGTCDTGQGGSYYSTGRIKFIPTSNSSFGQGIIRHEGSVHEFIGNISATGSINPYNSIISRGTFNRGAWSAPTFGALTQMLDNTRNQHSVIVGRTVNGIRKYGLDMYDTEGTDGSFRMQSGSHIFVLNMSGSHQLSGSLSVASGLSVNGDINVSNGYLKVGGKNFRGWGFSSGNVYYLGLSGDDKYIRMYNNDISVMNGISYLGSPSGRFIKLYSTQAVDVSSDIRRKTNILTYDEKIESFYDKLKPISYELINGHSGRKHYGFIAQEVESAMNEVGLDYKDMALLQKAPMDAEGNEIDPTTIVDYSTDERIVDYEYSLAYTEMISINTHMIQKLRAEITRLKNEISEIKGLG